MLQPRLAFETAIYPSLHVAEKKSAPELQRLKPHEIDDFLKKHSERRDALPEDQKNFMKPLRRELLNCMMAENMPLLSFYSDGRPVAGCAVLYPSNAEIAKYLEDYDFGDFKDEAAVISAVWTDPGFGGMGLSKTYVDRAMSIAFCEAGKTAFFCKIDVKNEASQRLFRGLGFNIEIEGTQPGKYYPRFIL